MSNSNRFVVVETQGENDFHLNFINVLIWKHACLPQKYSFCDSTDEIAMKYVSAYHIMKREVMKSRKKPWV